MTERFVSIVVPTYARPVRLRECLASLANLDYPRERFEVIVVDDGSPRPLSEIVAPFREQLDLTLLIQPNAGPGAARNFGSSHAKGDLIAFIDDDCRADRAWLRALDGGARRAPGAIVGGKTLNALSDNAFSSASQALVTYLYRHYNRVPSAARFFCSNNMAVPPQLFFDLGCFDVKYTRHAAGEDRALCAKWLDNGHRLVFVPEAVVHHAHDLTLVSFWRQHFTYGRAAVGFRQQHAELSRGPVPFEGWPFYVKLIASPFERPRQRHPFRLAVLLIVSQIANVAGFFRQASTAPERAAWLSLRRSAGRRNRATTVR